jgi:hypothetical protein
VKQIRKRLTYANVISTIALFIAIGGASAFAASQLAKNSVGTKQLKSNAVTAAKIKKEAVTEAKIKNGAVSSAKLGANAVTTASIADKAVTTGKLAEAAVTNGKLANDSVTSAKLAEKAVGTAKLEDLGVTSGKIATGAVTATQLGADSVTASKLDGYVEHTDSVVIGAGEQAFLIVGCAAGEQIVGIGHFWLGGNSVDLSVQDEFYFINAAVFRANNKTAGSRTFHGQVICLAA